MALEKEKNRLVLEKCQSILTALLKDEDNKYCVDCDAKSPRWASWNLGIFLCIRCAGIHRNLGVHISKVKSVNLDAWTPQQVACIQQMGNSRARAVYEANLQDNFRRPQTDSSLEQFIRAKYEAKKYIAREWVPPGMPNPTWDLEIEKQLKKKKDKKSVSGSVEFPATVKKNGNTKGEGVSPKPLPKAPGGRNNSPNQSKRTSISNSKDTATEKEKENTGSAMIDLLGLDTPSTANGALDGDADIFGEFLTAPLTSNPNSVATSPDTNKETTHNDESNFFNQKAPDVAAEKLSRDSILALYNQAPALSQPQTQTPTQAVYGGGGVYMGNPGMGAAPQQQVLGAVPQQQNMFYQQVQGGGHPPYYPQGMPAAGNVMYPSGVPPAGMQLSAANPFAQMQAQMGNMSMGSMATPIQHQQQVGNPLLRGAYMSNAGIGATPPQATTLSTNLWQ